MSLTQSDLVFLANVPLLAKFSPDEVRRFSQYLEPFEYEAGQVVIWENNPQRALSIVVRGVVVVTKNIRGDMESVLARLTSGAHFGELSLVGDEPAACNVTTEENCRVLTIQFETLERLFSEDSALFGRLAWAMLKDLADKLRATNRKVQEAVEWGLDAANLETW